MLDPMLQAMIRATTRPMMDGISDEMLRDIRNFVVDEVDTELARRDDERNIIEGTSRPLPPAA